MSFEFFDYDPLTGVTEYLEIGHDGKWSINYSQDVEPLVDHCKALANEGLTDECWRKQGAATYAFIPPVLQAALAKKGINFLDPNDIGRVIYEINNNYPAFKTTYKHHAIKG